MATSRHPCWGARAVIILAIALLVVAESPIRAQDRLGPITEIRAPEIFVQIGRYVAADDNGDRGSAISYDAVIVVPFSARFAAELDVQTSRVPLGTYIGIVVDGAPSVLFESVVRRTLVVPSLIYRFGAEGVYGLVGGGFGMEFENWTTRAHLAFPGSREVAPGIFERVRAERSPAPSFRGGVVAFPTRRLGIRGDVYLAAYSRGARIGIGYRFR